MRYSVGERVQRGVDVFKPSKMRKGTIVRAYSRPEKRVGDLLLGPYPELYDVLWDGQPAPTIGYLPHGIHPVTEESGR